MWEFFLEIAPGINAILLAIASLIGAYLVYLQKRNAEDIKKIEIATNSMKDQLVKTTAIASQAMGELKGRADQKAEGGA